MFMNIRSNFVVFLILSFACSCAISHNPLKLNNVVFSDSIITNKSIIIKTSGTDIFRTSGNERTARKVQRNKLQIVPLFITNNSADTFSITKANTEIFCNYEPAVFVDNNICYKKVRQKAGWHGVEIFIALLYYFPPTNAGIQFNPLNPTGILLPWGIYNIIKATKANKELMNDISSYGILDKKIAPGCAFRGFVCLKAKNKENLMFRFK